MKTTAPLFSLNLKDISKGFILAIMSALVTGLYTCLNAVPPSFPLTWAAWQPMVMVAIAAGISYIMKNFFTNSSDQFATKENAPSITPSKN